MKPRRDDSRIVALGAKFSVTEAASLRSKAEESGTTVSALLHGLVIKGVVHPRPHIDPIAIEQWRALAPIASNLNQLTRRINQGQLSESADVSDELIALRFALEEIRNRLCGEARAA